MKKKWMLGVGSMLLLLTLTACGGGDGGNSASDNGATAGVDAQAIYKTNCMTCHGGDLKGKSGPALNHIGAEWSSDEIRDQIENGGGGMPGFKRLGEDKIDALVDWLSAMK